MSETGLHPVSSIGLYGSSWDRAAPVLRTPRRFPEYLRLQNLRDRVDPTAAGAAAGAFRSDSDSGCAPGREINRGSDGVACSSDALGAAGDSPRVGKARDHTLARIGDVLPVDEAGRGSGTRGGCDPAARPAGPTIPVDGLGRMIDVIA